jgi:hypothetical protein
MKHIS